MKPYQIPDRIVVQAIRDAVAAFGDEGDGIFNLAGLAKALERGCKGAGLPWEERLRDGKFCQAVLAGRDDVTSLTGSHFKAGPVQKVSRFDRDLGI